MPTHSCVSQFSKYECKAPIERFEFHKNKNCYSIENDQENSASNINPIGADCEI